MKKITIKLINLLIIKSVIFIFIINIKQTNDIKSIHLPKSIYNASQQASMSAL